MKTRLAIAAILLVARLAGAQSATAPATAPDYLPVNLDHALTATITIDVKGSSLADLADTFRSMTHANVVMNWAALDRAGIAHNTPVELHLKDVPFEQVVKTLCQILPATSSRLNYTVGDNILTITTDAELGKANVPMLDDIDRLTAYTLEKEITPEKRAENEKFLEAFFKEVLIQAGEPMDAKGHALAVKRGTLAATVSTRGKEIVEKARRQLGSPTKPGQYVAGTTLTADAKKTAALFAAVRDQPLATLAQQAADHPHGLNIALLPGTLDPASPPPAGPLESAITDGGILLIGPHKALADRTMLGIYDLRDMIKRRTAKPAQSASPSDTQDAIIAALQSAVTAGDPPADGWKKFDAGPPSMTPFNGLLIVYATPEKHRAITEALRKMNP